MLADFLPVRLRTLCSGEPAEVYSARRRVSGHPRLRRAGR